MQNLRNCPFVSSYVIIPVGLSAIASEVSHRMSLNPNAKVFSFNPSSSVFTPQTLSTARVHEHDNTNEIGNTVKEGTRTGASAANVDIITEENPGNSDESEFMVILLIKLTSRPTYMILYHYC